MARILIIGYTTYIHDGRVKRHAEALVERGDIVDVICLAPSQNAEFNGVNVIPLSLPRYRGSSRTSYVRSYMRFFAGAAFTAFRLSLKHRYDLVIVCTMPDAAVTCAILPKLLGSKVVLDVHDTMPELYRDKFGGRRGAIGARLLMFEERVSARLADKVLAVHDLHGRRLEQAGIPANKIEIVMNVPDPRLFKPGLNGHQLDGKPFTMICHGTLTRRLGLDVAIHAVSLLRDKLPGLRLQVLGNGDYRAQAEALAASLNLGSMVAFRNPVPLERLPELLAEATIGLVPNRASSATHLMLPVKLLEYATLGVPVIAARLRTIEHYFDDDSVRYFAPDDPQALAAAIEELYCDPARRYQLSRNASEVVDRLCWSAQRENYYQAIDSLLPNQEG